MTLFDLIERIQGIIGGGELATFDKRLKDYDIVFKDGIKDKKLCRMELDSEKKIIKIIPQEYVRV